MHTATHPFCSQLSEREISEELLEPAEELRDQLHLQSVPFAYPFGDRMDADREQLVFASGSFSCLLGTAGFSRVPAPPQSIERVEPANGVDAEVFGRPFLRALKLRVLGDGR